MVFIGNAGGDNYEGRGRIYGLDAATGRMMWETYMVPNPGPPAPNNERMQAIARPTWGNKGEDPVSGGATWTSYTLDAQRGLLYIPGGNPALDFLKETRPGANLFSDSVVILDAKTGVYRNHFSIVPEDFHDWDVANAPTLVTTKSGKRVRVRQDPLADGIAGGCGRRSDLVSRGRQAARGLCCRYALACFPSGAGHRQDRDLRPALTCSLKASCHVYNTCRERAVLKQRNAALDLAGWRPILS